MLLTLRVEIVRNNVKALKLQRNGESIPHFHIILNTKIHHGMEHKFLQQSTFG